MAAPVNNQFWKLRTKHGRDAIFTDPKTLLDACEEYFKATDKRKWYKMEAIKGGKDCGKLVKIPTETPYSISGLCIFLGVNQKYLDDFENSDTYKNNIDFSHIITHVKAVIETQQFEGASVGTFNANIIARKLGLTDKVDHTTKGESIRLPDIIIK
jgi:hypothetical protein